VVQKRVFTIVCLLLTFVLLVAACAPQVAPTTQPAPQPTQPVAPQPTQAPATKPASASAANVNPAGEFPIVKQQITLKILIRSGSLVKSYSDNEFTRWLQNKTNIKLEFDVAPSDVAQSNQKWNLVLASGDLPDVIDNFNITPDAQQVLADQGTFIPLDDLINTYAFDFKKVMQDMPEVMATIRLANGKAYSMPEINDCYHCSLGQKMWVYKPWLDKLNLKMPETTDEFYQMLKAFKEKDPNGNGKADEIPLSAGIGSQFPLDGFLMNSFVYNSRFNPINLYLDNGTIKASFVEPGWKEGLRYFNKLYTEGLLDPQAFTNDGNKMKALGENPGVAILGASPALWYGNLTQNGGPSGRWKEYVPIAPLKGPTGLRQTPLNTYQAYTFGRWSITKACKNPEAAYRLVDLLYSFDAVNNGYWGREGIEWVRAKPGAVSIDGGQALYTPLKIWGAEEQNVQWAQALPSYRPSSYRLGQEYNPNDPLERLLYDWSRTLYFPYAVKDKIVPPLVYTVAQSKRFGELNTIILSDVDQNIAAFTTGKLNVDKDWDAYLKQLKSDGLDDYIKINQDAYDAKFKKK
jgi:putative aldouronate transport system substrate-binding protein